MCLVTKQTEPKVLKKDLIVYKQVITAGNNLKESRYYNFTWTKGKLEKVEMTTRCCSSYKATYHDNTLESLYFNSGEVTEISEGFHASKTKKRLSKYAFSEIARFLIPKGSLYYEDESGLIVANQMMLL